MYNKINIPVSVQQEKSGLLNIDEPQFGLNQNSVTTLNHLDYKFKEIAQNVNASEVRFPSLIPVSTLESIDYIKNFSNTLLYPCSKDGAKPEKYLQGRSMKRWALSPSACFHIYPLLSNKDIDVSKPIVFTNLAKVFRNEMETNSKWRLNEFTVREFVIVGRTVDVNKTLNKITNSIMKLAMHLNLSVELQIAHDPFFLLHSNKDAIKKAKIPFPSKREILYKSSEQKNIALGSINHHGKYFSNHFRILSKDGIILTTGCIGLGLERWVNALQEKLNKAQSPLLTKKH